MERTKNGTRQRKGKEKMIKGRERKKEIRELERAKGEPTKDEVGRGKVKREKRKGGGKEESEKTEER